MLKTKTAVILIVACSAIFGLLGAAGGAESVNRRWDAVDAKRFARDAEIAGQANKVDGLRDQAIERLRSTAESFAAANAACQQQFAQGTLLYETPPASQISIGLRGVLGLPVNITPGSNVAPRWWVPARIKPQIYGAAQGAVYYYVSGDGKADGPYLPAAPGMQQ
jgi:hypothetical protein